MKTDEVKHWIRMLEELQQDQVMRLEGNDSLIGIAVSIAEQYIEQQDKLERCLGVLEEVHETLAFSEHLGVISKLLHDLGRYKKSE